VNLCFCFRSITSDVPFCARPAIRLVHYTSGEPLHLECPVKSDPPPLRVEWQLHFVNGTQLRQPLSTSSTVSSVSTANGSNSAALQLDQFGRAQLTFRTSSSIAQASCWAHSELGKQAQPCYFNLVPAG
jgi:hypothetical protein